MTIADYALAALACLGATAASYVFVLVLGRIRKRVAERTRAAVQSRVEAFKVGGITAFQPATVAAMARQTINVAFGVLAAIAAYLWLEFCLLRFPYTQPLGEQLGDYLIEAVIRVGEGLVAGIPGLLIIVVIILVTRAVTLLIRMFFERVEQHSIELGWVDAETAPVTRRLLVGLVWIFALAMIYPYIPGSDSDAFKGLSVLLGVMVSLGATGVVGQAASGLILVYSRALRVGEFVRVRENEGTVTAIGLFAVKIATSSGEELSIPNSVIVGTTTRNYSRTPDGDSGAIDTAVTIGYGTPWRQVHAMLLEAAVRTAGIRADPAPYVRQTALGDFYVCYRLCARIGVPVERVAVLDRLHQNIQDVFNEYGVQIMSPHYVEDPAQAAIVPRERWYEAPARPAGDAQAPRRP